MTQDPVPLSPDILERFRAALQFAGAPLGKAIEPGISDEQIDELAGQLGVPVPPELRTLWRWGSPSHANRRLRAGLDINPEFELWPADMAVEVTESYREFDSELATYIAFAGPPQGGCLVVAGESAALISPASEAAIEDPDPVDAGPYLAPSLGVLFEIWTVQLASGGYKFTGDVWEPQDPLPWPRW